MAEPIDPTVDYAFRILFSKPGNEPILTNFLNAVFASEGIRLASVMVVNPFNEKQFDKDKLTIVDVKAVDAYGRHIQIEIQLTHHAWLHARILFTWSRIYAGQLEESDQFKQLQPAFSIWILGKTMFPDSKALHHRFVLFDPEHGVQLSPHLSIHTLELPKCPKQAKIASDLETWVYFFEHGKEIDPANPPEPLQTRIMRKAMSVLVGISQTKADYWNYISRVDARREQEAVTDYMAELEQKAEQAEQKLEHAEHETEQARQQAEQAQQQAEQAEQKVKQERTELKSKLSQWVASGKLSLEDMEALLNEKT